MAILCQYCGLLLFLFFCVCLAEVAVYPEVQMICDVIASMQRPTTSVEATVCWASAKKMQLHSLVSSKDQAMMVQFKDPGFVSSRMGREQSVLFLVDLSCSNISQHLEMSSTERDFRSPYRWLFIMDSTVERNGDVPKAIEDLDALPDSEVVIALDLGNDTYTVYYIYRISPSAEWRKESYGSWSLSKRFESNPEIYTDSIALRRHDLARHPVSVCFVITNNDTYQHLTDRINDHIDTVSKVNIQTSYYLLDYLNASMKLNFSNTWEYNVNGTWTGMAGYLIRNEIEIGGTAMFFTAERMSLVHYIASPTPTNSKFVFQQPKLSYENNIFLLSFKTNVWYSSVALVFLIYLVLFFVAFWEWRKNKNYDKTEQEPGHLRPNIADVAILILGATCQQGSPVELKGSLGRTVMLILFLALMFLYTSYSANIVALLQSSSSKIRTLDDLLHSRLKFGVDDTIYNRYYFSTATEPVRKAIYNTKIAPPGAKPHFMSMEEGVKNMQKGLFAFHMEIGVGYKFVGKYFQEGEKCGLKEIQFLQVMDPWLAVSKHTPYLEMYRIGYKRIDEHGLQDRENLIYYEKRPKCANHGANFVSVSMVDCYPALLVLTYGIIVSLFLLGLEILVYKREKIKEKFACVHGSHMD